MSHRYEVRVTYVLSKTYRVLAEDEDTAIDAALARTPRALLDAEMDAEVG